MKKNTKNEISEKLAIMSIVILAGISLFACKKTEAPIPKADIKIDVDANLSDGNKINEKEVKTQINNENNATNINDTTNNSAKEGVNKTDSNTNNSVNKGKNGENIENNTNGNKTEETKVGAINVGSIDINTSKTYDNTAEIEAQSKASLNKSLPTNSYGYTKEDIKNMTIPDYILASGDKESSIRLSLKNRDYLWEYMKDPANFKVDYSLSNDEFRAKYGTPKELNGHRQHVVGTPYTFGADGFPIEHPSGRDTEIKNPYNGKTYIYKASYYEWEDKDNPIERYVPSDEELNEIAKAYSASFK